jgi:hypothetical protein
MGRRSSLTFDPLDSNLAILNPSQRSPFRNYCRSQLTEQGASIHLGAVVKEINFAPKDKQMSKNNKREKISPEENNLG